MRDLVAADRVVELTTQLVAVDTRNPPGNEAALDDTCRQLLAAWQPAFQTVEPEPGRRSLVAELRHPEGPGPRPTLIINGHLDVVPILASAWTHDPFRAEVTGGRLYGRGTADMKGGIAAAIAALEVLDRAGVPPAVDVVFHLVADEEVGGTLGTKALLDAGLIRGDACLVPEPTSLAVCVAERGMYQGHLRVEGRPGHGSRPREGISAIEHAAMIVLALHAADFGGPEHPLLGRPTANIGQICGGSGLNTIAESARLGIDRRVLPGATYQSTRAELEAKIQALGIDDLRYELEPAIFAEASEMDPDDPFAQAVARAVASATGLESPVVGMTFTTDARFVRNQAGIPAVVCGPGDVAQAHSNDEWVSVDKLVDATAAYAELLATFGRQD